MNNNEAYAQAGTSSARFVKVSGALGCGKTQAIVERARILIGEGAAPERIGVFAATRSAADALDARFAADDRLAKIAVRTPQDYAVRILSDSRAQAATGRNPRILQDFEFRILTEDLKVVGIKPKRMREILKFFFKQYSEMGDEREDFLLSTEERMLHDAMRAHLLAMNAMLMQELSNVATKYVRDNESLSDGWRFDYVLADDWQNYSVATQVLLELLSRQQLFICGNAAEQVRTIEQYPSAEGFDGFGLAHEGAAEFLLEENAGSDTGIVAVENELVACEEQNSCPHARATGETSTSAVKLVKWTLPNAEFLGIADYIERRTRGGETPVHPRDIFVAVPNALWGRAIAKILGDKCVPSSLMVGYHALSGDPRSLEKSESLRAFTGLNLAADPTDAVAWRSWCGFGDYLTHSNHWCRLEEYAAQHGIGVVGMLDRLSANGARPIIDEDEFSDEMDEEQVASIMEEKANTLAFLGADVLVKRYRAGRDVIARCEGKRGFSLLNNIIDDPAVGLPAGFSELVEPVDGTEDAGVLYKRAEARSQIQFAGQDRVRIGLPSMACGLSFDTVIVAGMVDGFFPSTATFGEEIDEDRQRQIRGEERRELYAAIGAARRTLVLSCFARDDANSAEALGMMVHRIRAVDGKRMAMLAPSLFIDEMADAVPGFDAAL